MAIAVIVLSMTFVYSEQCCFSTATHREQPQIFRYEAKKNSHYFYIKFFSLLYANALLNEYVEKVLLKYKVKIQKKIKVSIVIASSNFLK